MFDSESTMPYEVETFCNIDIRRNGMISLYYLLFPNTSRLLSSIPSFHLFCVVLDLYTILDDKSQDTYMILLYSILSHNCPIHVIFSHTNHANKSFLSSLILLFPSFRKHESYPDRCLYFIDIICSVNEF